MKKSFPVYAEAWRRASYMARRFKEVRDSPNRREQLGARIALEEYESLLSECWDDAEAESLVRAALARRAWKAGRDPQRYVAAAADPELRGALLACRLGWLALSGRDEEALYAEALDLVGESPRNWMAKLAAIELRLGRGTRLARRGRPATAEFEEALRRAQKLPDCTPALVLRASALLKLGKPIDAWAVLAALADGTTDAGGLIVSAAIWLDEDAERSLGYAARAAAICPDHPEALNLVAAARLAQAQSAAALGKDYSALLDDALEKLDRSLPESIDRRVHRATALYLKGRAEEARSDLDAALAVVPELAAAAYLRGVVRFSAGEYEQAAEDWKTLIRHHPSWDSGELQGWIEVAQRRARR
jgi:tetratricopeptide (TPR) repeat protein